MGREKIKIKSKQLQTVLVCFFVFLLGNHSFANDSRAHISTVGIILEQSDSIVMLSENLFISPSKVRVEYEYFNESDIDQKLLVVFALPKIEKLQKKHFAPLPRALYLDFKTWINGEVIKLLESDRSWEQKQQTQKLLNDFENYSEYDFIMRQQSFPSNEVVHVVHEYTPAVGGGIPYYNYKTMQVVLERIQTNEIHRKEEGRFLDCVDVDDALNSIGDWISYAQNDEGIDPMDEDDYWKWILPYQTLGYILKTGKYWKGPIKDFTLTVTADRPFFLNTCFEDLKRTSDRSYELTAKDYVPTANINLMFHMSVDIESLLNF